AAVAPAAGASPARKPAAALGGDAAAARRTQQTAVSLEDIDAQQQRARAATVMQASGGAASNALTYLRSNPVAMVGALALLCGLGYGVYVYLQISNPGLFIRQAAKQSDPPPPPPAAAPAPAPTATAPSPDPMAGMAPPAAPPAPTAAAAPTPEAAAAAPSGAISASSVISPRPGESPRPAESPRVPESPRVAERPAEAPSNRGSIGAGESRPAPAAPPARVATAPAAQGPAADAAASRERIAVTPVAAQPRLNPALSEGYSALQTGDLEAARSAYGRALQSEPQNVDAMLGLAYLAAQENRTDDAMRFYTRILQLNPRHPQAQAAMIGLVGRADPIASETRLKTLLAREPSPFLHFVLGNLYADQSLWAQAQASYFQAHHLEPSNPDYAYNLAVGLDHLGQGKLALNFYRLADKLASAGRANFSVAHARERISSLSSQLD
ncbi:MAG TPA: tetratricopeptide repeat protein, partial [Burkholderiales bacterium]|nr:tetratricopeptide repeat protein [Burkholderiales bacterium]